MEIFMTDHFEKTATRVSLVSIIGNAVLSLLKLFAGIFAHSGALVSDAVHSASDVFSSIIVIIGVKLAAKEADEEHPYGHERIESVAAIVLAVVLLVTGVFIGHTAIEKLTGAAINGTAIPGALALVAAVVSIVSKEAMYWYTRYFAKKIDSTALMADAWHHRSDALSSIGSTIGVIGARLGYAWFDPLASLVICVFIVKAAYDIFADAIGKMTDRAISDERQEVLKAAALKEEGVLGVADLQTRVFGSRVYVDMELFADPEITLRESDGIARRVHDRIEKEFPKVKHITVVMRPRENE